MAAINAEYIQDIYSRVYLYTRLSDEYLKSNRKSEANELLRRGLALARQLPAGSAYQLLTEIARYYALAGNEKTAAVLLQEALGQVLSPVNQKLGEDQKGAALEAIIEQCFRWPALTGDILRTAIDFVYILDDPVLRVQLLTELGQNYRALDAKNRADTLIQQSIAAAVSIDNPWSKAEAFIRIARQLRDEGKMDEASDYLGLAVAEINDVDVLALSLADAQILQRTVAGLASFGRMSDSNAIINRLPEEEMRLTAQLSVLQEYLQQKSTLQARIISQRMLNQLGRADSTLSDMSKASVLLRLAELYLGTQSLAEATAYADAAETLISRATSSDVDELRVRLVVVRSQTGGLEKAEGLANLVADPYKRSQILCRLVDLPAVDSAQAASLLHLAEDAARKSDYLGESALAQVALSWIRRGELARGLGLLRGLNDAWTLGTALIDAVESRGPEARLGETETKILADLQVAWLRKPLPNRN